MRKTKQNDRLGLLYSVKSFHGKKNKLLIGGNISKRQILAVFVESLGFLGKKTFWFLSKIGKLLRQLFY